MEDVDLKTLVGEHLLKGVDTGFVGEANTISFTLGDKTYIALEDENDGYRSSMKSLQVTKEKLKNTFRGQRVVGSLTGDNDDLLQFIDCKTGKIVLRVGTDNSDDYYPCFVSKFTPENMAINAEKASPEFKIKLLRFHLDKAAMQFREYERQHLAKGTPESKIKADVNGDLAAALELVLEETK